MKSNQLLQANETGIGFSAYATISNLSSVWTTILLASLQLMYF